MQTGQKVILSNPGLGWRFPNGGQFIIQAESTCVIEMRHSISNRFSQCFPYITLHYITLQEGQYGNVLEI